MAEQTPNTAGATWSRYQRLKEILNSAAGSANPSYQGNNRFWELALPDFLSARLYGIQLIAPAKTSPGLPVMGEKPCCHTPAQATAKSPGRGARSGLIRGLRGQYPFDGTQFPPLPWGGARVETQDIDFIERWIDDGCPESDVPSAAQVNEERTKLLAQGHEAHPLDRGSATNAFRDESGMPKLRKNIEYFTGEELQRFRQAVARMKSFNDFYRDERSFGYWARIHGNYCQHAWEEFLTWHRAYLYFFEQQLQDIDPTVTLPYWDWSMPLYRDNLSLSLQDMAADKPIDNGIVPEAYRCWLDQQGLNDLRKGGDVPDQDLEALSMILDRKFDSGNRLYVAAGLQFGQNPAADKAIRSKLEQINPLWHFRRWPGGDHVTVFASYPTQADVDNILTLDNFFSFASGPPDDHSFGALENVHNLIHNFTGGINPNYVAGGPDMGGDNPYTGDMVDAGMTAFDPIFWAHHANVDRLWAEWQNRHPAGGPDNANAVLVPWNMTVSQTRTTSALGYTYVQSAHLFRTNSAMPITRFRSAPAEVHPAVVVGHRRAEIHLHKVQYRTTPGFHIRVFLNQPDASTSTPLEGNNHYVGQLNMFTGLCIGGPGHCDQPTANRRQFDHRKRPHKTPAHFRVDATDAVRRLRAEGATDFHVNLVVLNTDGTPADSALFLDAVSLNFYD